jgi:hypothetical protein
MKVSSIVLFGIVSRTPIDLTQIVKNSKMPIKERGHATQNCEKLIKYYYL